MPSEVRSRATRSILITGCSTGIGRTTAELLMRRGYNVLATARKQSDVDSLNKIGLNAFRLDVSDKEGMKKNIEEIKRRCNHVLYGIFYNAGYGQPGALEDISIDVLRDQIETNFFGMHSIIQPFIKQMREEGEGRIIINSSVLGFAAMPYRGCYNSSKFACEGWASTLRLETAGSGIYVSVIQPGPIDTCFRKNALIAFNEIDVSGSFHTENYSSLVKRLEKLSPAVPFTLSSEVVARKAIHALESKKPKRYYRVTIPTKIMFFISKFLPAVLSDKILRNGF